jgi:hypothetical protein
MSATTQRWVALAIFFAAAIPGMIVSSIADNNGAAATFGLVAASAAVALISVTAATTGRLAPDDGYRPSTAGTRGGAGDEAEAADLEARITSLVEAGADEAAVRSLVGQAIRFGRNR